MLVPVDRLMPVLFAFAVYARLLACFAFAYWCLIGVALALGIHADRVVPAARVAFIFLIASGIVGGVMTLRQPGIRERMAAGPIMVRQGQFLVLAVGGLSDLGGLGLAFAGSTHAAWWAMTIGTGVVLLEVAAIGGAIVAASLSPKGPDR